MSQENNRSSVITPPQKLEHPRAEVFKRGQVWYWEDPIYQSKDRGLKVDIGEVGTRYSRYVIIVQDPDTASKCAIVVVPCSSNKGIGKSHEVEVPIDRLYHDQHSYAKVQSIMNVHPRSLTQYICTIPDEAMKAIDAEILKMFCPYIRKVWSDVDIDELFGINMGISTIGWYEQKHESIMQYVRVFFKTCVIVTENRNDRISVQRMKEAFDLFCMKRGYIVEYDVVELLHCISKVSNFGEPTSSIFDIIAFSGCKFSNGITDLPVHVEVEKNDTPEEVKGEPSTLSTPEEKPVQKHDSPFTEDLKKMVMIGMREGKFVYDKIRKELNISQNTVYAYGDQLIQLGIIIPSPPRSPKGKGINMEAAEKFLKEYGEPLHDDPNPKDDKKAKKPYGYWTAERKIEFLHDVESIGIDGAANKYGLSLISAKHYSQRWKHINGTEDKKTDHIPEFPSRIDNINRGASALSNIITDFLRSNKVYNYYAGEEYTEPDFYSRMSTTIYYGILQYINVFVPRGGKPKLPKDEIIIKNIDFWWFLSMLHNDMALNGMKDYSKIREIYQSRYNKPATLPKDAIPTLRKRIVRFGLADSDAIQICSLIEQQFCK